MFWRHEAPRKSDIPDEENTRSNQKVITKMEVYSKKTNTKMKQIEEYTKEELWKIFENADSKSDCLRKLGYSNEQLKGFNGITINKILSSYAIKIGFKIENLNKLKNRKYREQNYLKNPKLCLECNAIVNYDKILRDKNAKFCSQSCAASFNNRQRGPMPNEQKMKISKGVVDSKLWQLNYEKRNGRTWEAYLEYSSEKQYCKNCNVELCYGNKSGYCNDCIKKIPERKELRQQAGKKGLETKKKNGSKIGGWTTRNIVSYPEQFWMKVLNNNNIQFDHNKRVLEFGYFLDFFIVINGVKLDLEIDGKQHKYRKDHDNLRDENLRSLDFVVYRIDWNDLKSDNGKKMMKEKIDKFLEFYESLK